MSERTLPPNLPHYCTFDDDPFEMGQADPDFGDPSTALGAPRECEPPFVIPRRVLRAPGLNYGEKLALGLLWAHADWGAEALDCCVLVWVSAQSLDAATAAEDRTEKQIANGRRTVMRRLKKLADAGYLLALRDFPAGHTVEVARRDVRGRWVRASPMCVCDKGSLDPVKCSCRVLAPIDKQGRPRPILPQDVREARVEAARARALSAQSGQPATLSGNGASSRVVSEPLSPPVEGGQPATQPPPIGDVRTRDSPPGANTATPPEPWWVTHDRENAPWPEDD